MTLTKIPAGADNAAIREIQAAFLDTNRLPDNAAIRGILESSRTIERHSRRLVVLTLVLIALTVFLAILTWRLAFP